MGKVETPVSWEFIRQYLPLYEQAAWLTLRLGLMGIALAVGIGLALSLIHI